MNKVAILIDSSFGIKNNQYPNVFVVPLEIIETKDGQVKTYHDGIDISNAQICESIKNDDDVKTAQPIIGEVMKLMDKLSSEYEKVFALPITSKLSKTYEMWITLAKEYKNVLVYDQTMVARLAEWTIQDFVNEINEHGDLTKEFVEKYLKEKQDNRAGVLFVPDISQLKKGGRVSNFKSLLIKLFGFKIIITLFKDGLVFRDKASHPEDAVKKGMKILSDLIPLNTKTIKRLTILTNDQNDKKFNISEYTQLIESLYPKIKIEYAEIPAIIIAHVGPNHIAIGIDLE